MNKDTVVRFRKKDEVVDPLVELLRNGAHQLTSRAVEEELQVFLEQQAGRREANGRLAVVRNGYQPERALLTGMGPVRVQVAYRGNGGALCPSCARTFGAGCFADRSVVVGLHSGYGWPRMKIPISLGEPRR